MTTKIWAALTLIAALGACNARSRSMITVEMSSDSARGTATMTCRASTSGVCHAVFLNGADNRMLDVKTGESGMVDGLPAGTHFCIAPAAPDPATCKTSTLTGDRQVIRHERRTTD